MILAGLILLGLVLGSFVNALVWRVHEQEKTGKKSAKLSKQLSIAQGRSMCPYCKHELAARDLIPVVSWLMLRGKCRYCRKPISAQYPIIELLMAALFAASYVWWPESISGLQVAIFGLWLVLLTGLIALLVYDVRWMLLPDRIIVPLTFVAGLIAFLGLLVADNWLSALLSLVLAVIVGGCIFYAIFQLSSGKWIGGGDVKLGWMLGLVMATPARSALMIFIASLLGTLVALPLIIAKKFDKTSIIAFGPFLIIAAIIVQLFGADILHWYSQSLLQY